MLVSLALSLAPSLLAPGALHQEGADASAERPTGQTLEDGVLVDHDFLVELRAPAKDWSVLAETDARAIVPDAFAGMRCLGVGRTAQVFLIAERVEGIADGEYLELVASNLTLEDRETLSDDAFELDGVAGLRRVLRGRLGTEQRFVVHVFRRGAAMFQLLVLGPEESLRSGALVDEALGGVTLLDGDVRMRAAVVDVSDSHGSGWSVEDGRFVSTSYGIAVDPPEGFRLAVGDELKTMSVDAEVGVIGSDPEMYLTITAEAARGEGGEAILASVLLDAGTTIEHDVAGTKRTFQVWDDDSSGLPIRFRHTAWLQNGRCFQLLGWSVEHGVDTSEAFGRMLTSLRFPDLAELDAAARRQRELGDADVAVTASQVLRGGVFVDFGGGVSWRKPEGTTWRATAGPNLLAIDEQDCALFLEAPGEGIFGRLYFDVENGAADAAAYHAYSVEAFVAGLEIVARSEPRTLASAEGGIVHVTEVEAGRDALALRVVVGTTWGNGMGVDLVLSGLSSNLTHAQTVIDAAMRELVLRESPLAMIGVENGRFVDRRMGFACELPEGWSAHDETPEEIAPVGSIIRLTATTTRVNVIAIQPPTVDLSRVDRAIDVFAEVLVNLGLVDSIGGAEEWSDGRLGALATKAFPMKDASDPGEAHVLAKGGVAYAVLLFGDERELEVGRRVFSLLADPLAR